MGFINNVVISGTFVPIREDLYNKLFWKKMTGFIYFLYIGYKMGLLVWKKKNYFARFKCRYDKIVNREKRKKKSFSLLFGIGHTKKLSNPFYLP